MADESLRVQEQARRVRESVLARHGLPPDAEVPGGTAGSAVEEAAQRSVVTAHWGIVSDVPVAGRFIVLAKRVARLLLRWYINPIVEQQNTFNEAAVRALYELRAENDELRARLERARVEQSADEA